MGTRSNEDRCGKITPARGRPPFFCHCFIREMNLSKCFTLHIHQLYNRSRFVDLRAVRPPRSQKQQSVHAQQHIYHLRRRTNLPVRSHCSPCLARPRKGRAWPCLVVGMEATVVQMATITRCVCCRPDAVRGHLPLTTFLARGRNVTNPN